MFLQQLVIMQEKQQNTIKQKNNFENSDSILSNNSESKSSEKSRKKLKRKPIKKMVHNFCVCFKMSDGSYKTIIHQRTQSEEIKQNAKELANKFKQEVIEVQYKQQQDIHKSESPHNYTSFSNNVNPESYTLWCMFGPVYFNPSNS